MNSSFADSTFAYTKNSNINSNQIKSSQLNVHFDFLLVKNRRKFSFFCVSQFFAHFYNTWCVLKTDQSIESHSCVIKSNEECSSRFSAHQKSARIFILLYEYSKNLLWCRNRKNCYVRCMNHAFCFD